MTQPINERQKKSLLIIPLIAIPFLALFFWALDGGKKASAQNTASQTGLNMHLPGARLKSDTAENKLSLYQQAETDSLKFKMAQKDDPNYHGDTTVASQPKKDTLKKTGTSIIPPGTNAGIPAYPGFRLNNSSQSLSANEQKVNQELASLKMQMAQPPAPAAPPAAPAVNSSGISDAQLQQLQNAMRSGEGSADPQMGQLNDMLDKIRDIQNPALAKQKMQAESEKNRGQVYAISGSRNENTVSTLDNSNPLSGNSEQNGFFSMEDNNAMQADSQNAVQAVIAETQTLVNGSTVKLRLVNDIYINGRLIPQNSFIYGTAALSGERLGIRINSVRYKKSLYPVSLSVYDMDGMAGVYIPGAITRDVAKESADQGVQNLDLLGYENSLGAQAASAGITAAKTLFSRKVRLIKVTVKAGYQVLLRDEKQKQFSN